jgi:type IV pilus assembly protein PilA
MDRTGPIRKTAPNAGFSLIELLIVVAIILIIAAVAIPNLLRARISANEASAASSVRKIATAQMAYAASYPTVGFAGALSNLGGPVSGCAPTPTTACILDDVLSTGQKSGYTFLTTGFTGPGSVNVTFVASSAPASFKGTGIRNFCIVTDGVLRADNGSGNPPASNVAACVAYPTAQ